ncbi:MAG: class I mannose-6-phosphate isomerase [Treponema sp.]|nr:class I mannose-6-phosphate isomerase [Treponema sp.]
MIKLSPIHSEKIWGYEDWIASTHPDGLQSDFVNTVKDFPLLVKIIQANESLSVQVHPDDKNAKELEGPNTSGKTECWYVLDAEHDSKLIYGFNKNYSKEEIQKAIETNTLEPLLNIVNVKKGDFIYIPAGTVHAIGKGLRLLEVQQSCNITYRLYDWGRDRELHIAKSLKSLKNTKPKQIEQLQEEFKCDYFELNKVSVKGGYSFFVHKQPPTKNYGESCQLVFISKGTLSARSTQEDDIKTEYKILPEEIYVVSPGEKVTFEGTGELIRIKLPEN